MLATNLKYKKLILSVIVIVIGLAIWLASNPKPPVMPFPGVTILPKPFTLPEFDLIDHHGKAFTNSGLKGKWSIMFFGYTHCPDICPTTLGVLNKFYKDLAPGTSGKPDEQIIFVTTDPIRDTAERMADHITYYNENFIGLTASSVDTVKKLGEEVGVIFEYEVSETHELITDITQLTPDADYQVEHNASIFIVDPRGRLVADILPPHNVDRISKTFNLVKEYY